MTATVIKTNGGTSFSSTRVEKATSDVSKTFAIPRTLDMTTEAVIERFPAAEEIAEAISEAIQVQTLHELPEALSVQRIQNYLNFLMYARIEQIWGHQVQHDRLGQFRHNNFIYPAVLWPVLCAIGNVEDHNTGMNVIVRAGAELEVWREVPDDVMNELYETRNALIYWGDKGLELADALPHSRRGDLRVLSMLVNGQGNIVSPNVGDLPADVMIRSLFEINIVENIFGLARVEYNSVEYYQRQFIDVVRLSITR